MKELTTNIDLDQEVEALAQFVSLKWTSIGNIRGLFTEIREAAFATARCWFDHHDLWEMAVGLGDAREALLNEALGEAADESYVAYYDALCIFLRQVSSKSKDLRDAALELDGEWDFTRRVRALQVRLDAKYPDLAGARPLGWAELEKGYVDFDGQAEYDPKPDRLLFEGSKVEGTLSGSFPGRVALPYVMYDEVCQGNKASHVLVGSVFAQFLGIAEFLNTEKLKQALVTAVGQLQKPVMLFDLRLKPDHPILKVIFELEDSHKRTEADWHQAIANRVEFKALSDEEKKKLRAENSQAVSKLLEQLSAESGSHQAEYEKRKAEKARIVALLKAALKG